MNPHNTPARLTEANFSVLDPGDGNTIPYQKWNQSCSLTVAGTETRVIPAPTKEGQRQTIFCAVNGGSDTCTVTVAGSGPFTGANDTSLVFNAVDDRAVLESVNVGSDTFEWRVVSSEGSPATLGSVEYSSFSATTITAEEITATTSVSADAILEVTSGGGVSVDGVLLKDGLIWKTQGNPTAETGVATITAADILTGIVTISHTTGSDIALTVDTGTAMDTALAATIAANKSLDWSVINTSAAAADTATLTAASGHTLVGSGLVQSAHSSTGGTQGNAARFQTRRTAANTWITYRIA